ncbi:MHYT domain-containing protein, partial [Salmonella enterica]|uniref:MHYT domain-containing protein n=2 Tax=Gammaproteobacteria TaxID=1236 RepID=UPI0022C0DA82|nr:hypothetical protein [Salmonella enterica]
ITIHYEWFLTLASLAIALIASLFALQTLSHARMRFHQYLTAATCMGLGIALMHYVGMAAMRSEAQVYFSSGLFGLSVAIAIGASLAALLLSRYLRNGNGMFHQ